MIKQFFQVWGSIQELLLQVHMIRGKVGEDVDTINKALKVYKTFVQYGLTDSEMIELAQNAGMQKNGL